MTRPNPSSFLHCRFIYEHQARFSLGQGRQLPHPNLSLAPPNLWLQQQYAVVKPANSYTWAGRFWRVGVVDLVVLICVLRATTKKRSSTFCLTAKYFPLEPPLTNIYVNGDNFHSDKSHFIFLHFCRHRHKTHSHSSLVVNESVAWHEVRVYSVQNFMAYRVDQSAHTFYIQA